MCSNKCFASWLHSSSKLWSSREWEVLELWRILCPRCPRNLVHRLWCVWLQWDVNSGGCSWMCETRWGNHRFLLSHILFPAVCLQLVRPCSSIHSHLHNSCTFCKFRIYHFLRRCEEKVWTKVHLKFHKNFTHCACQLHENRSENLEM